MLWPGWIKNEIDEVSIDIRILAVPSARGFALSPGRDSLTRPGNSPYREWMDYSMVDDRRRLLTEMCYS